MTDTTTAIAEAGRYLNEVEWIQTVRNHGTAPQRAVRLKTAVPKSVSITASS